MFFWYSGDHIIENDISKTEQQCGLSETMHQLDQSEQFLFKIFQLKNKSQWKLLYVFCGFYSVEKSCCLLLII